MDSGLHLKSHLGLGVGLGYERGHVRGEKEQAKATVNILYGSEETPCLEKREVKRMVPLCVCIEKREDGRMLKISKGR